MKNKKKVVLNVLKFGFLFLFFLYALVVAYNVFFGDTIVNFGFSYAIRRGEIPYNDFNLIIPLFSPFVYSFSLIFTKNVMAYYIMQSILLVFFFWLVERLLEKKVYLLMPLIFLGFPVCLFAALFPGYNFILLLLMILIIYLEKNEGNDYLLGVLIGLAIITKHTIGLFLIFPSLIYFRKDIKKIFKRIGGLLIPVIIFVFYLLLSRSFKNFIDLCIMGIFDFMKNNTVNDNFLFIILFGIGICYVIYRIIKSPKSIENYYVLISSLFVYPLLDNYHLAYFLLLVLILLFMNLKFEFKNKSLGIASFIFCIFMSIIWTYITFTWSNVKLLNYSNYPFRLMGEQMETEYNKIDEYIKKCDKQVVLFGLGTENYFYKITNNLDITYFDLPNYGNYGYGSYRKMNKRFDDLSDTIILVNSRAINGGDGQQYYRELALYVRDNYKYLEDVMGYKAYLKE